VKTAIALFVFSCIVVSAARLPRYFTATAYSTSGTTADGGQGERGVAAADPDLIPLGSRIRVTRAGRYSGVYVVKDTGRKIKGASVDIFIPSDAEAKRFGKKRVRVHVLKEARSER
jgi:3D (Asp-Asp-Asp) domain-containing protein